MMNRYTDDFFSTFFKKYGKPIRISILSWAKYLFLKTFTSLTVSLSNNDKDKDTAKHALGDKVYDIFLK